MRPFRQPPFYPLMRILLVKTSSLGDVVHNLPVVGDLCRAFPEAHIDWCVEESFADIPRLHPKLANVIPIALRRWRRQLTQSATWHEISQFRQHLRASPYDAVLDTQGLVKSALITWQARGEHLGYAREVAREPLAARFYDRHFVIPPNVHAVERNRWLAAAAFDFPVGSPLSYGIEPPSIAFPWLDAEHYVAMLTATSRDDKLWDEAHWITVGKAFAERGLVAVLPSGNAIERERAARLAAAIPGAIAAPPLTLRELAALLGNSRLTLGVDTGLVHLSAALGKPTIALYTATDPALTGAYGPGFVRNLGGKNAAPTPSQVLAVAEQELR